MTTSKGWFKPQLTFYFNITFDLNHNFHSEEKAISALAEIISTPLKI